MAYPENIRLNELIPDSIFPAAENFVALLKKYYEFMNLKDNPSQIINRDGTQRDIQNASKLFLTRIYQEIGAAYFPSTDPDSDTATILANLDTIYRAKGSLESVNALFSIVFGETVEYWLPKTLLFKTSQGDWQQDYSVTVDIISGDVFDLIGVFATVETQLPGQLLQTFEVEINRIEVLDDSKARIFLSRFSISAFYENTLIKHKDVECRLIATSNILLNRVSNGTNFRRGKLYGLDSFARNLFKENLVNYTQAAQDLLARYFNESVTKRRYVEDGNRIDKYGTEIVTRNASVDGLVIEDVIRSYETYRTIKYGNIVTYVSYGTDGSRRINRETNPDASPAPSVKIDWDVIIEELLKVAEGISGGPYEAFLKETIGGFARGDINNTGTIDLQDVESLVRRLMAFQVNQAKRDWIDTNIQNALLESVYPSPVLVANGTFKVLPILLDDNLGISTQRLAVLGYDYPETFISVLDSGEDESEPAVYIITSEFVARSSGYYNDVSGFTSDRSKIQDNDFYQDYSYVIRSGVTFDQFRDVIYKMTHPAGMKVFSEQLISETIETSADLDSLLSFIFNRLFNDLCFASNSKEFYTMIKPLGAAINQDFTALPDTPIDARQFTKILKDIVLTIETEYEYVFTKPLDDVLLLDNLDDSQYKFMKILFDQADAGENSIDRYSFTKPFTEVALIDANGNLVNEFTKGLVEGVRVSETGAIFQYEFYYDYENEGLYVEDGDNSPIPGLGYVGLSTVSQFN
jgi:hypothetical protein